jgi:3'-5' exoribonuclease
MKALFVSDLAGDQTITTFFLVHAKELRNTKEGKQYLRMELGDRSGTLEARMWTKYETAQDVLRDDFVKVEGRVELYRDRLQLSILQVRKARPDEIELSDFLPHTKHDVGKMWAELLSSANAIQNPWLQKLVLTIITDPEIAARYKKAPAAKTMHHAYLGGLLEHVVGLCGMAKRVAEHYPELNLDLLLTVAILHDVGKLDELCYARSIGYTTEGQLLGHIVMELETVHRAIDKIPGFPAELKTVVEHLLISHHGEYEFGSPKLPMIREALVFHYLDDLDSKMASIRAAMAGDGGDENWSAYSGALGRKFLRLDRFLRDSTSEPEKPKPDGQAALDLKG